MQHNGWCLRCVGAPVLIPSILVSCEIDNLLPAFQ